MYNNNNNTNANANANLPEWKRNQPTAWGCQSNQPTGRGGISSTSSTLYNPIMRDGVGYSGR